MKAANVFLLCFSITSSESFARLSVYMEEVQRSRQDAPPIVRLPDALHQI
jgi:hypothetical protein